MKINLTLQDNVMTARIVVSSENVRNMVERQIQQLRDAISEEGVRVDKFEVQVGQQERQADGNSSGRDDNSTSPRDPFSTSTVSGDSGSSSLWDVNRLMGENRRIHLIA